MASHMDVHRSFSAFHRVAGMANSDLHIPPDDDKAFGKYEIHI